MDEDILTIGEVAKFLRVSNRTVYDWAQKGEIPGGKIGKIWRFKKADIIKCVNERLSTPKSVSSDVSVLIKNILSPDRIIFINHQTKYEALVELASTLASAPQVKDGKELESEILKREELMSTALGRGIAIPHVRLSSVTDLVMAVGISKVDIIGFNPIDDEPVRLLFMIAASHDQHRYYLQTLSFLSDKLKNLELRQALLNSNEATAAYNLLIK